MSRMVFVTTELHPETAGGAGVVVDGLARAIGEDRECLVLLLSSQPLELNRKVGYETRLAAIPSSGFFERSQAAAEAIASVVRAGDEIEIQDFEGIAFHALAHRSEYHLRSTPISVRFHGPYDLLAKAMDEEPTDWDLPRAMETEAFRMADRVVVPAPGHTDTLHNRYGVARERVVQGSPLVPPIGTISRTATAIPTFAVVGRLGEMKGSQDMVEAAVLALETGIALRVRFIGDDGWSPAASSGMQKRLEETIPSNLTGAFEFKGPIPRSDLPKALEDTTAVVVPSRFESFCLAAHEARHMGLPVVVPSIAAFAGSFNESTGALEYDGSVAGLAAALERLASESALAERLARRPSPVTSDPMDPYRQTPPVRHDREQAGLATAATQRIEALAEPAPSRGTRLLERAYKLLPDSMGDLARKVLPSSLKDAARARTSWPAEQARRARVERLETVAKRIDEGRFPELDNPEISVVIPVFDSVEFLDETLASVYEQTHQSWEIIVVDDGSTDVECAGYLDRLQRPRLRLIRQENQGLPGARNAGIAASRGKFVIPLDSDDELEPEFMARTLQALDANPSAAFAHCYARLYHDIDAVWVTRPFNPYWQLLGNGVVGCVLLRKEAVDAVGGYDETMTSGNEDWELWVRLVEAGWEQVQIPEVLFKYRKHGVSMSVTTEAQFEQGRRSVRDRHPNAYELSSLRKLKESWYPLLTVLIDDPVEVTDVECLASDSGLSTTWGKYVADLRSIEKPPLSKAVELAHLLEENPSASAARTEASPPLIVRRRWNLHDGHAPAREILTVDDRSIGSPLSFPDHVERVGWMPGPATEEIPIQRQPPEDSGLLPNPGEW